MIEAKSLSYRYPMGSSDALDAVHLTVEAGELLLVAGGSGSGKSTLLRALNGLVPHFYGGSFSGLVQVMGTSTLECRPRDLAGKIGFIGQSPEDHMVLDRVDDEVAFTLENLGYEHTTMRKRVDEVLDALGIQHLKNRSLKTLSGGEMQRVAIASALVATPRFLVLDEPTSQLDPQSAEEVISAILRLRDELDIGVVLAEHRMERVLSYADRICVLQSGREDVGPPRQVLARHSLGSPVTALSRAMGWELSLDLRQARRQVEAIWTGELPHRQDRSSHGEALMRCESLSVQISGTSIISDFSFEAHSGQVIALMGRNGSGKTTLLRTLAGVVKNYGGHVDRPERVAMVPQDPTRLLFRPTVFDELDATLTASNQPATSERIHREAEKFGIAEILERYPRDLSGGQRTLAAIAAACAGEPSMILMDEPTRGIDELTKRRLQSLVDGWRADAKLVMIATHDVELAAQLADHVIILSEGSILVQGPPAETLAGSLTFSTQMNKVFRVPQILTVEDAVDALLQETR